MTESSGGEAEIRQSFRAQAEACDSLGSPFTATLCRLLAERLDRSTAVGRAVLDWPAEPSSRGDALALRLAGGLHALVLSNADPALQDAYPPQPTDAEALWRACAAAFETHSDFLIGRLQLAPQTNEVRRAAALLPAFLELGGHFAKPLVLSEVGASAGLNLHWDRFAYRLGGLDLGPTQSPVRISPEWRGKGPEDAALTVQERAGCDLNPLNPANEEDRLRLMSYVWADQTDRLERTRAALELAAANPVPIDRADAVDWLEARLGRRQEGAIHIVYHTIAWQYLPRRSRDRGEALITKAGAGATAEAPLARLALEADDRKPGAAISLQVWPGGTKQIVGRADFHGRWIEWFGWQR